MGPESRVGQADVVEAYTVADGGAKSPGPRASYPVQARSASLSRTPATKDDVSPSEGRMTAWYAW